MNPDIHSSPAMHKVEGETYYFFVGIQENALKINLRRFFVKIFQITFVLICISKYKWYYPNTSHMYELVLILFLLYCWLFDDSALVLGPAVKKTKTTASNKSQGKFNFSEKFNFLTTFMTCVNLWKIVCLTKIVWRWKILNIRKKSLEKAEKVIFSLNLWNEDKNMLQGGSFNWTPP